MFEDLFERPCTIAKYREAPHDGARLRYLQHLQDCGAKPRTLRSIASHQLGLTRLLDLGEGERVSVSQVEAAAGKWSRRVGRRAHRSTSRRRTAVFVGQLRHIDRAWASTVHAFQGRTVDTVIAAMQANHRQLTTQKTLYVEISRARLRAELVTDDRNALRERLEIATGERIAALEAVRAEGGKAKDSVPESLHDRTPEAEAPATRREAPEPEKVRAHRGIEMEL